MLLTCFEGLLLSNALSILSFGSSRAEDIMSLSLPLVWSDITWRRTPNVGAEWPTDEDVFSSFRSSVISGLAGEEEQGAVVGLPAAEGEISSPSSVKTATGDGPSPPAAVRSSKAECMVPPFPSSDGPDTSAIWASLVSSVSLNAPPMVDAAC